MSDNSFSAMGEKCGIASPPDTSVSSTSCVDGLVLKPSALACLAEDLARLESYFPTPSKPICDTEESEVTSSSEIISTLWSGLPASLDNFCSEPEKTSYDTFTDEDISCLQRALSTEEGMQILHQAVMKDLLSGYDSDDRFNGQHSSVTSDRLMTGLWDSVGTPVIGTPFTNSFESPFEFLPSHTPMHESHDLTLNEIPDVIPEIYASSATDVLYSDVLDVLNNSRSNEEPLFDDDDDDNDDGQIAIDTSHIDDLVLPDLPPVEGESRRFESLELEADDELVIDENLLQSFPFIDQSYMSYAEHQIDELDFAFARSQYREQLDANCPSTDISYEEFKDVSASKQLRRSTRIQENEQREMAERIRQENILKEREARRADGRNHEELEKINKRRDSSSSSVAVNSQDVDTQLIPENVDVSLGIGKDHSLVNHEEHGSVASIPQKRHLGQKGKGKGRGKGGKIGRKIWPASKAIEEWGSSNSEALEDSQTVRFTCKSEDEDFMEWKSVPMLNEENVALVDEKIDELIKVGCYSSVDQTFGGRVFCDEKLKATIEVRLERRLEIDSVVSTFDSAVLKTDGMMTPGEPGGGELVEEQVFSKPQTAKRRKRKRLDSSCSAENLAFVAANSVQVVGEDAKPSNMSGAGEEPSEPGVPVLDVSCMVNRGDLLDLDSGRSAKGKFDGHVVKQEKDDMELGKAVFDGDSIQDIHCKEKFGPVKNSSVDKILENDITDNPASPNQRHDSKISNKVKSGGAKPSHKSHLSEKNSVAKDVEEMKKKKKIRRCSGDAGKIVQGEGFGRTKISTEEKETAKDEKPLLGATATEKSKCPGCRSISRSSSIYCGRSCQVKYAKRMISLLREEKKRCLQINSSDSKSTQNLVLVCKSKQKRVSVPRDFSEKKLLCWLLKHPTYEFLKSNGTARPDVETSGSQSLKMKLKRSDEVGQDSRSKVSRYVVQTDGQPSAKVAKYHSKSLGQASDARGQISQSSCSLKTDAVRRDDVNLSGRQKSTVTSMLVKAKSVPCSKSESNPINHQTSVDGSINKITSITKDDIKKDVQSKSELNSTVHRRQSSGEQESLCKNVGRNAKDSDRNGSKNKEGSSTYQSTKESGRVGGKTSGNTENSACKGTNSDGRNNHSNKKHNHGIKKSNHGNVASNTTSSSSNKKGDEKKANENRQPACEEFLNPIRTTVRTELCGVLTSRCNRIGDIVLSPTEIRTLAAGIEDELWRICQENVSNYKWKYRSLVARLTDQKNLTLFRQVVLGEVKPNQLLRTKKPDDFPVSQNTSKTGGVQSVSQSNNSRTSGVSLAMSDTTSMHGQHVFDVNCRTCMGKTQNTTSRKRSTDSVRSTKTKVTECVVAEDAESKHIKQQSPTTESLPPKLPEKSVDTESKTDESGPKDDAVPSWLNTSPVIIPKNSPNPDSDLTDPRNRSRSVPKTSSLGRIKKYASDVGVPVASSDSFDTRVDVDVNKQQVDENNPLSSPGNLVWKGNIFAQDVALVAVDAYHLSGSMKFVKSILPESLTVMGRLEPQVVYDYLTKLKTCYSATKEIAVVCFRASNDPNSSLYSLLYSYLYQRHRCGVIGSIGAAIKDMYVVPLPAKAPIPEILRPDIESVLERGRDLLLGVIVQQTDRVTKTSRPLVTRGQHSHSAAQPITAGFRRPDLKSLLDSDDKRDAGNDGQSDRESTNNAASESSDGESLDGDRNDVIVSEYSKPSASSTTKNEATDMTSGAQTESSASEETKDCKRTAADDGDEPYDPFDEEDEEFESTDNTKSSESLPPPLSGHGNAAISNESTVDLTSILRHIAHLPGGTGLLATLAAQAVAPSMEEHRQALAQLALLLGGQLSAVRQDCKISEFSCNNGLLRKIMPSKNRSLDNQYLKPESGENQSSKSDETNVASTNDALESAATVISRMEKAGESGECRVPGEFSEHRSESESFKLCGSMQENLGESKSKDVPTSSHEKHRECSEDCGSGEKDFAKVRVPPKFVRMDECQDEEDDDNDDHLIIDLDSPRSEDVDRCVDGSSASEIRLPPNSVTSFLPTTVPVRNGGKETVEQLSPVPQKSVTVDRTEMFKGLSGVSNMRDSSSGRKPETDNVSTEFQMRPNDLPADDSTTCPEKRVDKSPSDEGCKDEILDSVQDEDIFVILSPEGGDGVGMSDTCTVRDGIVHQEHEDESLGMAEYVTGKLAMLEAEHVAQSGSNFKVTMELNSNKSERDPCVENARHSVDNCNVASVQETLQQTSSGHEQSAALPPVSAIEGSYLDPSRGLPKLKSSKEDSIHEGLGKESSGAVSSPRKAIKNQEVAPLPAPPRPPENLLRNFDVCLPILQPPPSPKTLLRDPFHFHMTFASGRQAMLPHPITVQHASLGKPSPIPVALWSPFSPGQQAFSPSDSSSQSSSKLAFKSESVGTGRELNYFCRVTQNGPGSMWNSEFGNDNSFANSGETLRKLDSVDSSVVDNDETRQSCEVGYPSSDFSDAFCPFSCPSDQVSVDDGLSRTSDDRESSCVAGRADRFRDGRPLPDFRHPGMSKMAVLPDKNTGIYDVEGLCSDSGQNSKERVTNKIEDAPWLNSPASEESREVLRRDGRMPNKSALPYVEKRGGGNGAVRTCAKTRPSGRRESNRSSDVHRRPIASSNSIMPLLDWETGPSRGGTPETRCLTSATGKRRSPKHKDSLRKSNFREIQDTKYYDEEHDDYRTSDRRNLRLQNAEENWSLAVNNRCVPQSKSPRSHVRNNLDRSVKYCNIDDTSDLKKTSSWKNNVKDVARWREEQLSQEIGNREKNREGHRGLEFMPKNGGKWEEEEHEEGEYVDELEEEEDGSHGCLVKNRLVPQASRVADLQPSVGSDAYCSVKTGSTLSDVDRASFGKLTELTVQVDCAGAEIQNGYGEELEDGEIADMSPVLSQPSVSPRSLCSTFSERNVARSSIPPLLSKPLLPTPPTDVPRSNFTSKSKRIESQFSSSVAQVDSGRSRTLSIDLPNRLFDDFTERYSSGRRGNASVARTTDTSGGGRRFLDTSRNGFWRDSQSHGSTRSRFRDRSSNFYPPL